MHLLDASGFHSQSNQQVYWMLNWNQNNQVINNINQQQGRTFQASHNRFSYLSQAEIEQTYLTLKAQPSSQPLIPNVRNQNNQMNFAPVQYMFTSVT
jgi:hypothetical protein